MPRFRLSGVPKLKGRCAALPRRGAHGGRFHRPSGACVRRNELAFTALARLPHWIEGDTDEVFTLPKRPPSKNIVFYLHMFSVPSWMIKDKVVELGHTMVPRTRLQCHVVAACHPGGVAAAKVEVADACSAAGRSLQRDNPQKLRQAGVAALRPFAATFSPNRQSRDIRQRDTPATSSVASSGPLLT